MRWAFFLVVLLAVGEPLPGVIESFDSEVRIGKIRVGVGATVTNTSVERVVRGSGLIVVGLLRDLKGKLAVRRSGADNG